MVMNALYGVWPDTANPADHHYPARITKADKKYENRLDFKDIKFPLKTKNIYKIEKKNYIWISVFSYENKVKYPIYVSKRCCEDKHVGLLLIGEGEKKHFVLIKDFNTFMYDHTLHCEKKKFCCYCLKPFRTAEKLKCHIKDYFKINGKQTIKMAQKVEYIKFKNFGRKIKSSFMIYVDFESILVPDYSGKQNLNQFYINKYQNRIACSYDYKLLCVNDKLSNLLKSFLGEDAVYNFITSMIK